MKNIKSYIIAGDMHVPFNDADLHVKFCKFLRDFRPDGFIINGDFLDLYSISRHLRGLGDLEDKGRIIKLKDEFKRANNVLDDYGSVLPRGCLKVFHDGNHCDRLSRYFSTDFNAVLDGLFSIDGVLHLKERGYLYKPGYPNNYTNLGKLTVTHGAWTPVYAAAKHVQEYRGSVAVSHTHTSQVHYFGGLAAKQVGICIGHMADTSSKGMQYAKAVARWVQGFLIVYVAPSGEFWYELINAYNGTFFHNKKEY